MKLSGRFGADVLSAASVRLETEIHGENQPQTVMRLLNEFDQQLTLAFAAIASIKHVSVR